MMAAHAQTTRQQQEECMPEINLYGQTVGDAVPGWEGAGPLPVTPLSGRACRLEALNADRHSDDLFLAWQRADDARDWTWLGAARPDTRQATWRWVEDKVTDDTLIPWAVIDLVSGRAVGVVCFMRIDRPNGVVEIGHVTWSPLIKRTLMSTEAQWLLLNAAFAAGYRRVEWKCDSLNAASRAAAERLGFTYEGRFRQAMVRNGRNRDTDWFSLLDREWPRINAALTRWMAVDNFDAQGRQIQRLGEFLAAE